jgi:hypothetical protein
VFHTVHRSDPRVSWTSLGTGPIPTGKSAESYAQRLTQCVLPVGPTSANVL